MQVPLRQSACRSGSSSFPNRYSYLTSFCMVPSTLHPDFAGRAAAGRSHHSAHSSHPLRWRRDAGCIHHRDSAQGCAHKAERYIVAISSTVMDLACIVCRLHQVAMMRPCAPLVVSAVVVCHTVHGKTSQASLLRWSTACVATPDVDLRNHFHDLHKHKLLYLTKLCCRLLAQGASMRRRLSSSWLRAWPRAAPRSWRET